MGFFLLTKALGICLGEIGRENLICCVRVFLLNLI